MCPHVDRLSQQVFVPCWGNGVTVARLDSERLEREGTLTCVRFTFSVDVMSPNTIFVCEASSDSVYVVDVRNDRLISRLETPDTVRGKMPYRLSVLGDSVIVDYGDTVHTLVVYRHGGPARVIPHPGGLKVVTPVSTDWQRHFLLTDYGNKSVFVMDASGKLHHTVNIDTVSELRDCAVINRKLWVGCGNGDIVIMSSH